MIDSKKLHRVILERLSKVIDPETGVDVVRMQLIKDLTVDKDGNVSYTFCPSSPFCPIAVPLSNTIQQAVAEVLPSQMNLPNGSSRLLMPGKAAIKTRNKNVSHSLVSQR